MSEQLTIERASYSPELAAGLGKLLVHLSDQASGLPVDEKLRLNTESSSIEQLTAHKDGRLVGAATLTQLGGVMPINKAWLEDFVVAPEARGQGVAGALADEWEQWCRERNITTLLFTSGWQRQAAHGFYLRRGAVILNNPSDKTAFLTTPSHPNERIHSE